MKKRNITLWLICIVLVVTFVVVLQRISDMPDFLRGTLTGICLGLLVLCVLSMAKAQPQEK